MDWADEIANGFCSAGLMDAGQVLALDKSPERYAEVTKIRRDREASERKEIAAALRAAERRGRAAGMREAAETMFSAKFHSINNCPYCGTRDLRKSFYRAGEDSGHEIVCIPEGRKIICAEEILFAAAKLEQPD
jgi:hypothetical protein